MGHERIGFLPKTQQWNRIIAQMATYSGEMKAAAQIADATLSAVKDTYQKMPDDESVMKAIRFLSTLSYSANTDDQIKLLRECGYNIDDSMSFYSLAMAALNTVQTNTGSLEVNKIAKDSLLQTLSEYQQSHTTDQLSLFKSEPQLIWSSIGNGAAFCELARSFFAAFTDRQLRYYIERAAASTIDDYQKLQSFSEELSQHTASISHHAFETSKIMQSFAAGWYNNHSRDALPTDAEIYGFLKISFGKMREEFRREADGV